MIYIFRQSGRDTFLQVSDLLLIIIWTYFVEELRCIMLAPGISAGIKPAMSTYLCCSMVSNVWFVLASELFWKTQIFAFFQKSSDFLSLWKIQIASIFLVHISQTSCNFSKILMQIYELYNSDQLCRSKLLEIPTCFADMAGRIFSITVQQIFGQNSVNANFQFFSFSQISRNPDWETLLKTERS